MAFKTAGEAQNGGQDNSSGFNWQNIREGCCPRCAEELVDFQNINLYKCRCGFKIGYERMRNLLDDMDVNEEDARPAGGFAIGDYEDELPF